MLIRKIHIILLIFICKNSLAINYFDLTLEELMNINISSASKWEESSFESSTASYVITEEDIKRSGATSIPEILRLAPGVQVARIDSDEWAVGIRGFNDRFSDKLLVLIDGRSSYVPLFSGVYWNSIDYILPDIEKIEVIRGPGGSLWGANAVNGVINIITKKAKDTQGKFLSFAAGNYNKNIVSGRYGGQLKNGDYYSMFLKNNARDMFYDKTSGNKSNDDWAMKRAGLKYESVLSESSGITFQSELYDGVTNQDYKFPDTNNIVNGETDIFGGNAIVKYTNNLAKKSKLDIQLNFDYDNRDEVILDRSNRTVGLNIEHQLKYNSKNEIVYGLEYRNTKDNLRETKINGTNYLSFDRPKLSYDIFSAFFQNKSELVNDKLFFTLGSKFEYNDFTHSNIQPTARISYIINKTKHLWAAVSKAVRQPTRWEDGFSRIYHARGAKIYGNQNFDNEKTTSYELGYKSHPFKILSYDLTAFYNDYDNLRGLIYDDNTGNLNLNNSAKGESYGFEVSANYDPTNKLRLALNYSFIRISLHPGALTDQSEYFEDMTPYNQLGIMAYYNINSKLRFDNHLYYNDNLSDDFLEVDADSYIRFDSNISYKLLKGLEVSLIGQNLTDSRHNEWGASLYSTTKEVGRTFLIKVNYEF